MNVELSEAEKIKILNSTDLYGIMQRILLRENKIDQNREHFWVVGLATNNRILFIELISKGTIKQTLVEPMEVFSLALQKRAVKIVLVHNHPSGELKPSESDKNVTNQLIQVGKIINTKVIDHLIISAKDYLSFGDIGLLARLEVSTKYVPPFALVEQAKKEAAYVAESKKAIEIAKAMKRRGVPVEEIGEMTGLSIAEIEKLRIRRK